MQNQRSKYVSQMYKEFKEQYGANAKVAMGFSQTNVFSKAMTLMIAVNPEDHRVIDAWAVTDNDMEIEGRTCAEYLGIDINKYAEDVRKRPYRFSITFKMCFFFSCGSSSLNHLEKVNSLTPQAAATS